MYSKRSKAVCDVAQSLCSPFFFLFFRDAGKNLEPFWNLYAQHKAEYVYSLLEEMRIGNIDPLPGEVTLASLFSFIVQAPLGFFLGVEPSLKHFVFSEKRWPVLAVRKNGLHVMLWLSAVPCVLSCLSSQRRKRQHGGGPFCGGSRATPGSDCPYPAAVQWGASYGAARHGHDDAD